MKASEDQSTPTDHIEAHVGDSASNVTVGRDISSVSIGDIHGNMVDTIIAGRDVIIQRLDPTNTRNQRNHFVLRQTVRRFWIDGVLKSSLHNEVLIRLKLGSRLEAVDNLPWKLVLQQTGQPDRDIADDKSITDIFNEIGQELLILGEPGSGKTTTLLTLADALLATANVDPTQPTPVIFNLSSWAEKQQPLEKWLIEELNTRYYIRKDVAQSWIENDALVLLLDGLDEVVETKRIACIKMINDFRKGHMVGVAVCSRTTEYMALTMQLRLGGAVVVRPLSPEQIEDYLGRIGSQATALRHALNTSDDLRELAQSPLLLSVMTLAYQNIDSEPILSTGRSERQYLFDRYIRCMFEHRESTHLYAPSNTLHWLHWLAEQMAQRSQTIFLIERLQPDWLLTRSRSWLYRAITGLITGLSIGLIAGLLIGLRDGLIGGLYDGLTTGLIFGLSIGPIVGLIVGLNKELSIRIQNILPVERLEIDRRSLRNGIVSALVNSVIGGLIFGLIIGVRVGLSEGLDEGWTVGLSVAIGSGLIMGLGICLSTSVKRREVPRTLYPNQGIWHSAQNMLRVGLSISLGIGLIFGLGVGLRWGFTGGLRDGLSLGLSIGLSVGLIWFGGLAFIQHFVLRILLWRYNLAPLNYAHFLNHCHDRIFLRKVGGGYIFIHRLLMEHFASLTDEDITRLAGDVKR